MKATAGSPKSNVSSTAFKFCLYETICNSSTKEVCSHQTFFLEPSTIKCLRRIRNIKKSQKTSNSSKNSLGRINQSETTLSQWFVASWGIARPKTMWSLLWPWRRTLTEYCSGHYSIHILGAHLDKFNENVLA